MVKPHSTKMIQGTCWTISVMLCSYPNTCLHSLPPYPLYHGASCFEWLLTKLCPYDLLGLCLLSKFPLPNTTSCTVVKTQIISM